MSGWGYLDALTPSMFTLFPMYFAIILLALNDGVKYENKSQAKVAMVVSVIILAILFNPFSVAMADENHMAIFRTGTMILTTVVAIFFFVRSFLNNRFANQNKR